MKHQFNSFRYIILYVFLLIITLDKVHSGTLEKAKVLFGKKEYSKVLKELEQELEKEKPSIEILQLAMESSLKSGQILTKFIDVYILT